MHRATLSTIINYVGTEHHVEKYPAHKWHFWVWMFSQISLVLIVRGIILL